MYKASINQHMGSVRFEMLDHEWSIPVSFNS